MLGTKELCKLTVQSSFPVVSGGSTFEMLDAPPGPNSFIFMQFLGKFGKIVCWRAPVESWRPHLKEILNSPLVITQG